MWYDVKRKVAEEKMLWLAVFRRAIFDYALYKGVGSRSRDWKTAFQYIFRGARMAEGLTFDEVCGLFGWNAEYVRRLTTRLTKADVKKLESIRFKSEFVVDVISVVVENNVRWSSGAAAPFLPPYNYIEECREKLALKEVRRPINWFTPIVKWSGLLIDERMVAAAI